MLKFVFFENLFKLRLLLDDLKFLLLLLFIWIYVQVMACLVNQRHDEDDKRLSAGESENSGSR